VTRLDYQPIALREPRRLPRAVAWSLKLGPIAFALGLASLFGMVGFGLVLPQHWACCEIGNPLVAAASLIGLAATLTSLADAWTGASPGRWANAAMAVLAACMSAATVIFLLVLRA
jgi:hypothetical protein